ncbi:MAG: hypothetical protein DSM106950_07785 [Stigonema ocellatum SAG 48.90 = DSM 106950]|nr:hypothetical protein [Stigonema ocellatum SAG 48.90 = DSM 106950]
MVRFHAVCFACAALLLSFGTSAQSAMAQTTYPFEATYNSENTLVPITENVSRITINAQSTDAPYGLTNFANTNYGLIDLATGTITFRPDATEFGLQNLPSGNLTFFGEGSDQLFGTITGTAKLDFQNLVGTATGSFNITGGSGKFSGATGTFSFVENDILNLDQTALFKSQAVLSGSFQTPQVVPKPRNITALVSMGVIGVGFGLRRRSFRVAG